jgi:hypothetical protein
VGNYRMAKPELQITYNKGLVPIKGICSSCRAVFRIKVPENLDRAEALEALKTQFHSHVSHVHKREDFQPIIL